MTPALADALANVDGACPCRRFGADYCAEDMETGGCEHCRGVYIPAGGEVLTDPDHPCHWPGHAAARTLMHAAQVEMRERSDGVVQEYKRGLSLSHGDCCDSSVGFALDEACAAIRALTVEEEGR